MRPHDHKNPRNQDSGQPIKEGDEFCEEAGTLNSDTRSVGVEYCPYRRRKPLMQYWFIELDVFRNRLNHGGTKGKDTRFYECFGRA